MDDIKSVEDYAKEVWECIKDHFDTYQWGGSSDDFAVIRDWYMIGIEPHYVLFAISEGLSQGEISPNFKLQDIKEFVKNWYKKEAREEAEEARKTFKEDNLPYNKIEKLARIVKSVLIELNISDFSIVDKIISLKNYPNLFEIEKSLADLEEEFLKIVERNSPKAKKCRRRAESLLKKYSFYWDKKIVKLTKRTLVKKCLRRVYGIPEFSII